MMRVIQLVFAVGAILPLGIHACTNPDTDACASAFANNLASASAFCHTFTTAVITASTGLPSPFASACSSKTSKLSAECTCYVTGAAATTTTTAKASLTSLVSRTRKHTEPQLTKSHRQPLLPALPRQLPLPPRLPLPLPPPPRSREATTAP